MVCNPINRQQVVCSIFPTFKLAGCNLTFVAQFKYLGHIIDNELKDCDIKREIKNLFLRANLLCRRFQHCWLQVISCILHMFLWYCFVEKN